MKHINLEAKDKGAKTSSEWLKVGAAIAQVANKWAKRDDLIAYIGEEAAEGSPAIFKPLISEIEINTKAAFGFGVKPEKIGDFVNKKTQYEFPKATGAVFHEACHARFSNWNIEQAQSYLKEDEFQALMLLEEGRIEAFGIKYEPDNRSFLRSTVFEIVLGDLDLTKMTEQPSSSLVKLVGLVQARVIAGVLDDYEVEEINSLIVETIGEEKFNRLSEICQEFQKHNNHSDMSDVYPLAIEWASLTREIQKENGEQVNEDGSSSISEEMKEKLQEVIESIYEAIENAAGELEINNAEELNDQQEAEEWQEIVNKNKDIKAQVREAEKVAKEVFSKKKGEETGESTGKSGSTLTEVRKPKNEERKAAVLISRMLEKAKYRERDITEVATEIPAGRLRPRALIQNEALKAKGSNQRVPAWRKRVRKTTDEPTLNVGVMVDISGSMSSAMQPMATTAWVMSEAVKRVQGKTAMVYYGSDVFPTLKPGQHLNDVMVYTAPDNTEKFDKAFKALDGSLNLLNGNGVRMLVVVSDGIYTGDETKKATKWIQECHRNGVAVLWLTFDGTGHSAKRIVKNTNTVLLSSTLSPEDAATEIGKACATALESATALVA